MPKLKSRSQKLDGLPEMLQEKLAEKVNEKSAPMINQHYFRRY